MLELYAVDSSHFVLFDHSTKIPTIPHLKVTISHQHGRFTLSAVSDKAWGTMSDISLVANNINCRHRSSIPIFVYVHYRDRLRAPTSCNDCPFQIT